MNLEDSQILKLDAIDKKVLFWILEHSPRALKSWLEYTEADYRKRKNIIIDSSALEAEITDYLKSEIDMSRKSDDSRLANSEVGQR